MPITTGMHPAAAAAQADYVTECDDCGEVAVKLFMRVSREWDEPDRSVGHYGGWIVTGTMIGAQVGDFVLSQADAATALGALVPWVEREVSERLTECDDSDAPRAPSRMEAAE